MEISEKVYWKLGLLFLALGASMMFMGTVPLGYSYSSDGFTSSSQLTIFGVPFSVDQSLANMVMDLLRIIIGLSIAFLAWGCALSGYRAKEKWNFRSWQFMFVLAGLSFVIYTALINYLIRTLFYDQWVWNFYILTMGLGYIGIVLSLNLLPRTMGEGEKKTARWPIVFSMIVLISSVASLASILLLTWSSNIYTEAPWIGNFVSIWYSSSMSLIFIALGWMAYALMDCGVRARLQTKALFITAFILVGMSWIYMLYISNTGYYMTNPKILGVDLSYCINMCGIIGTIMMFLLFAYAVRRRGRTEETMQAAGPSPTVSEVKAE